MWEAQDTPQGPPAAGDRPRKKKKRRPVLVDPETKVHVEPVGDTPRKKKRKHSEVDTAPGSPQRDGTSKKRKKNRHSTGPSSSAPAAVRGSDDGTGNRAPSLARFDFLPTGPLTNNGDRDGLSPAVPPVSDVDDHGRPMKKPGPRLTIAMRRLDALEGQTGAWVSRAEHDEQVETLRQSVRSELASIQSSNESAIKEMELAFRSALDRTRVELKSELGAALQEAAAASRNEAASVRSLVDSVHREMRSNQAQDSRGNEPASREMVEALQLLAQFSAKRDELEKSNSVLRARVSELEALQADRSFRDGTNPSDADTSPSKTPSQVVATHSAPSSPQTAEANKRAASPPSEEEDESEQSSSDAEEHVLPSSASQAAVAARPRLSLLSASPRASPYKSQPLTGPADPGFDGEKDLAFEAIRSNRPSIGIQYFGLAAEGAEMGEEEPESEGNATPITSEASTPKRPREQDSPSPSVDGGPIEGDLGESLTADGQNGSPVSHRAEKISETGIKSPAATLVRPILPPPTQSAIETVSEDESDSSTDRSSVRAVRKPLFRPADSQTQVSMSMGHQEDDVSSEESSDGQTQQTHGEQNAQPPIGIQPQIITAAREEEDSSPSSSANDVSDDEEMQREPATPREKPVPGAQRVQSPPLPRPPSPPRTRNRTRAAAAAAAASQTVEVLPPTTSSKPETRQAETQRFASFDRVGQVKPSPTPSTTPSSQRQMGWSELRAKQKQTEVSARQARQRSEQAAQNKRKTETVQAAIAADADESDSE